MTVKTSISLADRHHAFAERKAKERGAWVCQQCRGGGYRTSDVGRGRKRYSAARDGGAIRERMNTPRSEWLDGVDDLFGTLRDQLVDQTSE